MTSKDRTVRKLSRAALLLGVLHVRKQSARKRAAAAAMAVAQWHCNMLKTLLGLYIMVLHQSQQICQRLFGTKYMRDTLWKIIWASLPRKPRVCAHIPRIYATIRNHEYFLLLNADRMASELWEKKCRMQRSTFDSLWQEVEAAQDPRLFKRGTDDGGVHDHVTECALVSFAA